MKTVLLIRDVDVKQAEISVEEVIAAVEDAYRQDGLGHAQDTPRREVRVKGKDLPHIAPGTESVGQGLSFLEDSKVVVISHAFHFSWHRYITEILDSVSGETLAIILRDAAPFGTKPSTVTPGDLRTGSAAAIGAKYLARKDITEVGLVGTGRVGRASLLCLSKVLDFDKAWIHSGRKRDESFADEMSRIIGKDIQPAESIRVAVERSDVLITATYSTTPIIRGSWIKPGTHISGMGSDDSLKAELDPDTFRKASKIVIDGEKALTIGEVTSAMNLGAIKPQGIYGKIGELVAGRKVGRESNEEITVFISDGTNIQSAGVSLLTYRKVKKLGLGLEFSSLERFFYNP